MVGSVIGSGAGQTNQMRRPKSTYPRLEEEEKEEDVKGSKKANKMSCWAFIFLLAVDAFTIGLVIFLFSHHHFEGNLPFKLKVQLFLNFLNWFRYATHTALSIVQSGIELTTLDHITDTVLRMKLER